MTPVLIGLQVIILGLLVAAIAVPNWSLILKRLHRIKPDPNASSSEDMAHRHMVMSILPYMSQVTMPSGDESKVLMLEVTSMDGLGKMQVNTMLYSADTAAAVGFIMTAASEQMKNPTPAAPGNIPEAPQPDVSKGANPHGYL